VISPSRTFLNQMKSPKQVTDCYNPTAPLDQVATISASWYGHLQIGAEGIELAAYIAGRLSVQREGGENLFHRLLFADLKNGLE
jgi:hypothetical protein